MQPTRFNDNALLHEASKSGEDMETPQRGKSPRHKLREGGIVKFDSHGIPKGGAVLHFVWPENAWGEKAAFRLHAQEQMHT